MIRLGCVPTTAGGDHAEHSPESLLIGHLSPWTTVRAQNQRVTGVTARELSNSPPTYLQARQSTILTLSHHSTDSVLSSSAHTDTGLCSGTSSPPSIAYPLQVRHQAPSLTSLQRRRSASSTPPLPVPGQYNGPGRRRTPGRPPAAALDDPLRATEHRPAIMLCTPTTKRSIFVVPMRPIHTLTSLSFPMTRTRMPRLSNTIES